MRTISITSQWNARAVGRVLSFALLSVGLLGAARASAGDQASAPQPGAAMRMYRDPESGRIGAPPAGAMASEAVRAREMERTSAAEELTAEAVAAPAGGVKVNLRGRFRAAVVRHTGGAEATRHMCIEAGAAAHE